MVIDNIYDIDMSQNREHRLTLIRDLHCWSARLVLRDKKREDKPSEFEVVLQIDVKTPFEY